MEQAEDMPRHLIEARAFGKLDLDVGHEAVEDFEPRRRRLLGTEQRAIDPGQEIGIGIGGAAEHDAIDLTEMSRGVGE